MSKPTIPCPACGGKGKIELSDPYYETVTVLLRLKRASPAEVHAHSPDRKFISVTAANQRLERLRKWGFVGREREGKVWKYFVKEKKK